MKNPIQPLEKDDRGVFRFKGNAIVEYLYDFALSHGCGLNELCAKNFSKDDRQQFAQLLGYSLGGYGELSYVDTYAYETAERMATQNKSDEQARIEHMEDTLKSLRDSIRKPMAQFFGVHPDDLK